ncbi:MAG: DUF177 domain-containing protein [Coriobacteriia bacterium]|nr:DUF177 domain-containing protein [Coriobacteriia bacterium]
MESYPVEIAGILDTLGESISVSDTLTLTELDVGDEHFALTEPISFTVTLTNGGTGVVALGTVVANAVATCARCLIEFPLVIEADVDGYFVHPGDTENIPEEQDFAEIGAEGFVDILPEIMSALVLEAPFAPLHADDCAGICPECGADMNTEPCGCDEEPDSDNPFASLGDLLTAPAADED